jgi:DNA-directed RNA polymerase subunit K/omega
MHTSNIIEAHKVLENYDPSNYQSPPIITKFEIASVKGLRLEQLSNGAPTMLTDDEANGLTDIKMILEKEFKLYKIPFMIMRTLPNNEKEVWKLEDLAIL